MIDYDKIFWKTNKWRREFMKKQISGRIYPTFREMGVLAMVKSLLPYCENALYHESFVYLLEAITTPLNVEEDPRWFEKRIIAPPMAFVQVDNDVWKLVVQGLKENRIIEFFCSDDWSGVDGFMQMQPYQLLLDSGIWHLHGYLLEEDRRLTLPLHQMKKVALTEEVFTLPEDYECDENDVSRHLKMATDPNKRVYKIFFSNKSVIRSQDRIWGADQKIVEMGDGIVITFISTELDKVLERVLSQGADARPLEPEFLVHQWMETIEEMQKRLWEVMELKPKTIIDLLADSIFEYLREDRIGYKEYDVVPNVRAAVKDIGFGAKIIFCHSPEYPLFCGFEGSLALKERFIRILTGPFFKHHEECFWDIRVEIDMDDEETYWVGREARIDLSCFHRNFLGSFVFLRNCFVWLEDEARKIFLLYHYMTD